MNLKSIIKKISKREDPKVENTTTTNQELHENSKVVNVVIKESEMFVKEQAQVFNEKRPHSRKTEEKVIQKNKKESKAKKEKIDYIDSSILTNTINIDDINIDVLIKNKKTQLQFYIDNKSKKKVIKLAKLNNTTFGAVMEKIIAKLFGLAKAPNRSEDLLYKPLNCIIEHKSSRYWRRGRWKGQHIFLDSEFKYLIFSGLGFTGINSFIITKDLLADIYYNKEKYGDKTIIKQGKAEGQGLWFYFDKMKPYLTPIKTKQDLQDFIENNQ